MNQIAKELEDSGLSPRPASGGVSSTSSGPTGPSAPARKPNAGWFKKGVSGPSLTTGLWSDLHPGSEALLADVDRFEAAQITDEGEAEGDIQSRRRELIRYRARIIHKNVLKLASALEERGLVDKRGKLRVAWLSKLESLINTAIRVDSLLGLDRHPKEISLQDYINGQRTLEQDHEHQDTAEDHANSLKHDQEEPSQ